MSYLQKYRKGDTANDEVTRAVSPSEYVDDIVPRYIAALEPLKLPFFVIMAPGRQLGGAND